MKIKCKKGSHLYTKFSRLQQFYLGIISACGAKPIKHKKNKLSRFKIIIPEQNNGGYIFWKISSPKQTDIQWTGQWVFGDMQGGW